MIQQTAPSTATGATPGVSRVRCYLDDGAWYAVAEGIDSDDTWAAVGTPVAMTLVAGGGKVTLSGTDAVVASGATDVARPDPATVGAQGRVWYVALSDLGVPAFTLAANLRAHIRAGSKPTTAHGYLCGAMLSAAWATSTQTRAFIAITHDGVNHKIVANVQTSTFTTLGTNAEYTEAIMDVVAGVNSARWSHRNTARTVAAVLGTSTPGTATITHLGISIGATGNPTSSNVTFGDPQMMFSWSQELS